MGLTTLAVTIVNPAVQRRSATVECIIDTGATYSVIQGALLRRLGVRPDDKITLSLADGRHVTRKLGEARFLAAGKSRVSTVIFGEKGDADLLGVVTLETMGLFLDPLRRKLRPLKVMAAGAGRMRGEVQ